MRLWWLFVLAVCSVTGCAPKPVLSSTCVVDLKLECAFAVGATRVALEAHTLTVSRSNQVTWRQDLAADQQFKEVSGINTSGGLRLAYSVLHCPTQCLSEDIVVIDEADQATPREVFRWTQFGAGAHLVASADGRTLEITQQIFQLGDMCCPSGTSTTHFTWNGETYVATP